MTASERHDLIAAARSELWGHHERMRQRIATFTTLDTSEPQALGAKTLLFSNAAAVQAALAAIRSARRALAALEEAPAVEDVGAAVREIVVTAPTTVDEPIFVKEVEA